MVKQNLSNADYPEVNTEVRYLTGRGDNENYLTGEIMYVSPKQDEDFDQGLIVVARNKDQKGSYVCHTWEVVSPLDVLTPEDKQKVTDLVLASAKAHGYCSETKKVLADLGLPTEKTLETRKMTVEIEYTVKPGFVPHVNNIKYEDDWTREGNPVIEFVKVTEKKS